MFVCDMFGETIRKTQVDGGGTHSFNNVDGHYIDLTVEQLDLYNIPIFLRTNEEMDSKYCGKHADKQKAV